MGKKSEMNNELCEIVGKNIIRLRKNAGLKQTELGDLLDVQGNTVSRWELGNRDMTISQLEAVANFFGVEDWNEFKRTDWMDEL